MTTLFSKNDRPRKRHKWVESEPLPPKSDKFWFEDGTLVLITSTKSYRIHIGILIIQSPAFEDKFGITRGRVNLQIEGCPAVNVPDFAEDWDVLLGVLYNVTSVYTFITQDSEEPCHVLSLDAMLAFLRLGHKYRLEKLKVHALQQAHAIFPQTLSDWDRLFEGERNESSIIVGREFETLRAIEDLKIESALPMAYFSCIRERQLNEIMQGRDEHDGPIYLSEENRSRLIQGKQKILEVYPTCNFSWLCKGTPSRLCEQPEACKNAIIRCLATLVQGLGVDQALDPDRIFKAEESLCFICTGEAVAAYNRGRRDMFNALPSYFGLPRWDQLKDF